MYTMLPGRYSVILLLFLFGTTTHFKNAGGTALMPPPLTVPPDLEATVWAQSPMVQNIAAIDTDIKGRIWVAESSSSLLWEADTTKATAPLWGRIVILEDSNQDGKADKSLIFATDSLLKDVQGVSILGRRIVVACARYWVVYTDADGDDRPEKQEKWLTAWGAQPQHRRFRPVVAGPDGNWYGSTQAIGGTKTRHQADGSVQMATAPPPDSATLRKNQQRHRTDVERTWAGGMQLRLDSEGKRLRIAGHGFSNSFETCVDSYGDMWQGDNDAGTGTSRLSWLREGANAGAYSTDGSRTGQQDQRPGQSLFEAQWHQEDPGFMTAGDDLGGGWLTGVVINESEAMGKHYRGMLLCADAARHSIFSYMPRHKGAGFYLGRRRQLLFTMPEAEGLPLRGDPVDLQDPRTAFVPTDLLVGTDGAWYVADAGQGGQARIHRIAPNWTKLKNPVIDLNTEAGPVEALKSPAVNVRYSGFEALLQRGNNALPAVAALLQSENPWHQARSLFLLARLGEQAREEVWNVLQNSTDERLRHAAFRALRGAVFPFEWQGLYSTYSADPTLRIRCEVAIGTRDLPLEMRQKLVPNYFRAFDGDDPWFLDALGTASEGMEEFLWPHWLKLPKCKPDSTEWNYTLSKFVWRLHPRSALPTLEKWAAHPTLPFSEHKKAIVALAHIPDHNAAKTLLRLSRSRQTAEAEEARYWLAFRQTNDWKNLIDWNTADLDLYTVRRQTFASLQRACLLHTQLPAARRLALAVSMTRDSFGGAVLTDLAAKNQLPPAFQEAVAASIFQNPLREVRTQASLYFKRPGSDRKWPVPAIEALAPDAGAGKSTFVRFCASCHANQEKSLELKNLDKKYDRTALTDRILNPGAFPATRTKPDPVALGMTGQQVADVTEYLLRLSH